jgi:large subunit ribosomal protein L4
MECFAGVVSDAGALGKCEKHGPLNFSVQPPGQLRFVSLRARAAAHSCTHAMASARIISPMRGVQFQLCTLSTVFARSITTTPSSVSPITTSVDAYVPIKPFTEQTVLATIHQFPSLEPLRLETFPANHLYLPTRRDILHRAIVFEGDATRAGTASTKNRYEVRGSARKIRPQKGSGRARLGDKKSPMLRGGGVSHGPRPRDFSTGLQKKVYDLAWRTALSYRFRRGELIIVDNAIEIESPSQHLLEHIFDRHNHERGSGRSLMITVEDRPLLAQALDKMNRRRQALTWKEVDVKVLLELSRIIIERSALQNILFAHQEDLTHKSNKHTISSLPSDLESILGWSKFCDLMQTPPLEREVQRPNAYESICYDRIARAETLPEGHEKTNLKINAYGLLAESFDLRREQLPLVNPLEDELRKKEDIAGEKMNKGEALLATISVLETRVRIFEIQSQACLLDAQAAEHRRDIYHWKGELELADAEESKASDKRTDLAGARVDLLTAKKELAQSRAQAYEDKGDMEGCEQQLGLARTIEDELQVAMEEAEQVELSAEDLELIEEEERGQAELETLAKKKENK